MKLRRAAAADWAWRRSPEADETAMRVVQQIIGAVRARGDEAVRHFTAEHDFPAAADPAFHLRIDTAELERAWAALDPDLQGALERAADRIRRFHAQQRPADAAWTGADGERLGWVWRPLRRVGVYAPGGRAAYPSTVLMNVIPAQVAGVDEVVLVSPPQRDTGLPHPLVMAAAHLLGVQEVYRVGGAQAIAALAYGTQTISRVDKVAGPGNLYVTLAKRAVMGDVGIDSLAGPSEVFIVADDSADPACVAADMLAQAEHDPEAGAVLVTLSPALADRVEAELDRQLADLPKRDIAAQALGRWGAVVLAASPAEALDVVNRSAPEHLELLVADAERWLDGVRTAGAVFVGHFTPEPVADYYAGTNHVLPTHGSARFASGLGVHDFLRRMSFAAYTPETLARHQADVVRLARAEGLEAHARAVEVRAAAVADRPAGVAATSGVAGPVTGPVAAELPAAGQPAAGLSQPSASPPLRAAVSRTTGETSVQLELNLRGRGEARLEFPVPFLQHMLHLFAVHGRFDLTVRATGDVAVDDHHLVEDIGLCLGKALHQALGDKRGIRRYGERHTPMDETLARAVVDLSGRPSFVWQADIPAERVGTFPTELAREFFKSFAHEGRFALHLAVLYGADSHHMIEAMFKAVGAALRQATSPDGDAVPSSKGVLE
ncbi:MAG: histidinol dehydrogenase [Alicyclobacillaceae bacterium]|nr:histidinol dehydrogenase [Alicyclobacillaceae bacterium]